MSSTVGVVLPTRDRIATLADALSSVLNQSHPVDSVVVVDDGSTDGTAALLKAYAQKDSRLRVLTTGGIGAPKARNIGIAACNTDYLAFQDSDDIWSREFIATLLPHAGRRRVVFSSHYLKSVKGEVSTVPPRRVENPRRTLRRRNVASTQTVLADRQLLVEKPFNESLERFQDWDLWLSLLAGAHVEFVHVNTPLVLVRRQPDSISESSRAKRQRALRAILRRHFWTLVPDVYALARLFARAYLR